MTTIKTDEWPRADNCGDQLDIWRTVHCRNRWGLLLPIVRGFIIGAFVWLQIMVAGLILYTYATSGGAW